MTLRERVLQKWLRDWRVLVAWRRDLSEVEVEISDKEYPLRLGTCWSEEQRLVVYRGKTIAGELDTLIHELAHAATIGDGHGDLWQATYAAAVEEVTGIPIPGGAENYRRLCQAGKLAVASWWKTSGNEFAWRLLGGK